MNQVNDLPDPSERDGRVMMWLGHNLMPLMAVWAAFVVPDDLLGNPGGLDAVARGRSVGSSSSGRTYSTSKKSCILFGQGPTDRKEAL
jgi:hypothetical protein